MGLIEAVKDDVLQMVFRLVEEIDAQPETRLVPEVVVGDHGKDVLWHVRSAEDPDQVFRYDKAWAANLQDIIVAEGYGEPGYKLEPGQRGVVLANWNEPDPWWHSFSFRKDYPNAKTGEIVLPGIVCESPRGNLMKRIGDILEWAGYELEWSDEWVLDDNLLAYRTSPNGHGWVPSFSEINGDIVGHKEIKEDPEDYLAKLEGDPTAANSILSDEELEEQGYIRVDEVFETGLHSHQNDDPKKVASILKERGFSRFLFSIESSSMFGVGWSLWLRPEEIKEKTLPECFKI